MIKYFFEIWSRGHLKDYLKEISSKNPEEFHPHLTLARPFNIIKSNEETIIEKISEFCKKFDPIFFTLEGQGDFYCNKTKINSPKITNHEKLLAFHYNLESLLEKDVEFFEKIEKEKKLHVSYDLNKKTNFEEKISQYMLRLTAIKDKKIWFSFDFVTKKILNREESLDKIKWLQTVNAFTNKYKMMPTREGFKKIY